MSISEQNGRIASAGSTRRARLRAMAAPLGIALASALATGIVLPRNAFVASAIVGIEGGQAGLRPALAQAAVEAASSRQVLTRAAASGPATADMLSRAVRADTGHVPGSLVIRGQDGDAERAAAMASAVATALVADLEESAQDAVRAEDAAAALRLVKLQDAATAAHRRLADLGGDVADAAATAPSAVARMAALRTRLDAIHAIIAAGSPPLGTGRDVPANIDALQSSYLDLTRQLAKASETLGERHTTVIGLRDGIKRTAAELTAAWTRLAKATEADLAEAKSRATLPSKGVARDAGQLALARAAAQAADEAVARGQGATHDDGIAHYRLIARAPIPALAEGLTPQLHLAAATLAGLLMLLVARRALRPKAPAIEDEPVVAEVTTHPATPDVTVVSRPFFEDAALASVSRGETAKTSRPEAAATATSREDILRESLHARTVASLRKPPASRRGASGDVLATMTRVLPSITALSPRDDVPVVMIATNEPGASTMDAVLALGEAAAATGRRVLIVEGANARPALAAAVDEDAAPALIEVFGDWRVVLRAEAGAGLLYLAPSFRDGARLAEELAAIADTLVADALADEFDLVLIDGDRASDARALAREADGLLRLGRFASARDDERFMTLLDTPRECLLGTVATDLSVFVPSVADHGTRLREPARLPEAAPRVARLAPRMPFVAGRRPIGAELRRRAAMR